MHRRSVFNLTQRLFALTAIVAGERDPQQLAHFRESSCKHSEAEIAKALTGRWDEAQLFILEQALEIFDYYSAKITECDIKLEQRYQAMESRAEHDAPLPNLPPAKKDSRSKNALSFNARAQIARVIGVDLVAVMGLSAVTVQTIISEIGTDMECFATVKHFCSWLGLAPHNDKSGGKVLRSRTMKVRNRATQAFRQAARYSCWISWIIPLRSPEAIRARFYTDAVCKTTSRGLRGPLRPLPHCCGSPLPPFLHLSQRQSAPAGAALSAGPERSSVERPTQRP
jgi:hypothetical protein